MTFTPLQLVACIVGSFALGLYVGAIVHIVQRGRDTVEIKGLKVALKKLSEATIRHITVCSDEKDG